MNTATRTIKRLALVAACFGLLTLSTAQRAEAETNTGSDPSSNATSQVLACQAMGGKATVKTTRTVAEGAHTIRVTCTGGMGGGWECVNFDEASFCNPTGAPAPTLSDHDPSIGTGDELWEVIDDGGVGSPVVTQPAPDATPSVAAPDDEQEQAPSKTKKDKKSKKGKKGGKGRKK